MKEPLQNAAVGTVAMRKMKGILHLLQHERLGERCAAGARTRFSKCAMTSRPWSRRKYGRRL